LRGHASDARPGKLPLVAVATTLVIFDAPG